MKCLLLLGLISIQAIAAPLTINLNLKGVKAMNVNIPYSTFISTNPLCNQIRVIPLPSFGPSIKSMVGSVKIMSDDKVILSIPIDLKDNNFCHYIFSSVAIHFGKSLEFISLESTYGNSTKTIPDLEVLDILSNPYSHFTAKCSLGLCQTYVNQLPVGRSKGNVARFYLGYDLLNKSSGAYGAINLMVIN